MKMEYEKIELEHAKLMERLAKPCHSQKSGFTEDDKIEAIRKELKDSEYKEIRTDSYSMWVKRGADISNRKKRGIVMVSSHADFVSEIKKPSSKLDDSGYYKGTYDNLGTNAAAVILMKEENLPENVVFVFTSEEETGRCTGLHDAVKDLRKQGAMPVGIALDVTHENYTNGGLCSIENISGDWLIDRIGEVAMNLEPENCKTFSIVPLDKKRIPSTVPADRISKDFGVFDEAFAFEKDSVPAFSLCLPCTGYMHSESGVKVRQPVFEGYVLSLYSYICALTKSRVREPVVEAYKDARAVLYQRSLELVKEEKEALRSYSYSYPVRNYSDYPTFDSYWAARDGYWTGDGYVSAYGDYEGLDDDDYIFERSKAPDEQMLMDLASSYEPDEINAFVMDAIYMYFDAGYTPDILSDDSIELLASFFCEFYGLKKYPKKYEELSLEDFYDGYVIDYGVPEKTLSSKPDHSFEDSNPADRIILDKSKSSEDEEVDSKEEPEELYHQMSLSDYSYTDDGYIDYEDFE